MLRDCSSHNDYFQELPRFNQKRLEKCSTEKSQPYQPKPVAVRTVDPNRTQPKPWEFKNATSPVTLDLCLSNTRPGKSHNYRDAMVFKKFRNVCTKTIEKPKLSNSSGVKCVLENLRSRDGLVWTVGLNIEIELRFQISLAYCGRYLNETLFQS